MQYKLIAPKQEQYNTVEQILTNRGISLADIPHYLNLNEKDNLSPKMVQNIDQGLKMLMKHLLHGYIFVQVDSDDDGYTSAANLANSLHSLFPTIVENRFYFGFHNNKTHGLNLDLIPEKVTLVIAPDSSSNDYEIHKELANRGIDVLVIDHHQAEKISEYACVINNQLCDYPTKSLSGVGMVYKFIQNLDHYAGTQIADKYLDLVAMGLIGDMMDQRDFETSYLIHEGLKNITNPFFKGMAKKNEYSLGEEITPMGAAFYIVPFVNAVTRVGSMDEKKLLFNSMLEWKASKTIPSTKLGCQGQTETVVEQAVRVCTNVKSRQDKMKNEGVKKIEALVENKKLLSHHKVLLIKLDEFSVDRNLSGLIANELIKKYQRPVAILNRYEENGQVRWEGSARGYDKSPITDFRHFVRESNYAYLAEGHPNAFGIGFQDENINAFELYCDKVLKNADFGNPCYHVDYIFSASEIRPDQVLDIGEMKDLWGKEIEEPYVAIEDIKIQKNNIQLMSRNAKPTIKILLPNGIELIKFKSSEEEFNALYSEQGCTIIDVVGRCSINKYYGKVTPQILIEDYDIVGTQAYYF